MRHHSLLGCLVVLSLLATGARAAIGCGSEPGAVRILSNEFDSLRVIAAAALECASPRLTVTKNQTTQHAELAVPALKADPAKYTVVILSNNTITALLDGGLLRPLDDLVALYGRGLQKRQLVTVGGKIMAVAFMVNAQHLYYRADVLERAGVAPPTSYEQVLEAARRIRAARIMRYPLAATNRPDWDLAQEFINMYLGYGGELFDGGSARATIANERGVKALGMMKALTAYMRPDFLTYNTDSVAPMWAANEVAMANLWGSRANAFLTGSAMPKAIAQTTRFAAAPTVGGGSIPSTTLWWDGFAIARNIDPRDAKASFQTMMHAIAPEVANAHPGAAVWLSTDSITAASAVGVLASVKGGAKSYPTAPYMGYLHNAIGANLASFMQGRTSATSALQDAVTSYTTAVREAGYLR